MGKLVVHFCDFCKRRFIDYNKMKERPFKLTIEALYIEGLPQLKPEESKIAEFEICKKCVDKLTAMESESYISKVEIDNFRG